MEHYDATGVSPRDKRCEKLVRTGINGCSAMAHPLTHLTHGISTRRPFHPGKTCSLNFAGKTDIERTPPQGRAGPNPAIARSRATATTSSEGLVVPQGPPTASPCDDHAVF